MRELYNEGTKVFYCDYDDKIKEGIVESVGADENGADYWITQSDGKETMIDAFYVDIDKKTLLLRILLDYNNKASNAKYKMSYCNERANEIYLLLVELDKNINVKKELENYKNKIERR